MTFLTYLMSRSPATSSLLLLLSIAAVPAPASEPSPQPLSCPPIPGIEALPFEPGVTVLFGEIHGTEEAPDLFAGAVCTALREGRRVRVGLELPVEDEAALASYLDSEGTAADRQALLSRPIWSRSYQDGRTSRAVLELIEELRRLHRAGYPVTVSPFDEANPPGGQARDRAMAQRLTAVAEGSPGDLLLVLTGNVHSRLAVGTPWDESYQPMAYLMAQSLPQRRFVALNLSSTGGSAWICQGGEPGDCGVQELGGRGEGEGRKITFGSELDEKSHHGTYHVGGITASPPAVEVESPTGGKPGGSRLSEQTSCKHESSL